MSEHTYTRALVAGTSSWDVDSGINKDIETALPGKLFVSRCFGTEAKFDFTDSLDATEITTLDTAVSDYKTASATRALDAHKKAKMDDIDVRTRELIVDGFTHSGKTFSLSTEAQLKISGDNGARGDITYPVVYGNIDDTDTISLANAPDLHAMWVAARDARYGHLKSGTDLKVTVRAAATIAAVDAVMDNR